MMSNYRISLRTLDYIIDEALRAGIRAGEMKRMGNTDPKWHEYMEEARRTITSNAKTMLLEDARQEEDRNNWAI